MIQNFEILRMEVDFFLKAWMKLKVIELQKKKKIKIKTRTKLQSGQGIIDSNETLILIEGRQGNN